MTGFEIAGIALGVFPIVVKGLTTYLDGSQQVEDLWRWKSSLKSIVRELKTESAIFENTCECLLEGFLSADEITSRMSGEGWDDITFQYRLKERLGTNTADAFTEGVQELFGYLLELKSQLGLDDDVKEGVKVSRRIRRQWRTIKLVLRKANALEDIRKVNSQLERLTKTPISPVRSRQHSTATVFNSLRVQAIDLHKIFRKFFQEKPGCLCPAPHTASVPLEILPVDRSSTSNPRRLKVLFSFDISIAIQNSTPWKWREFEFEPMESTTAASARVDVISGGVTCAGKDNAIDCGVPHTRTCTVATTARIKSASEGKPADKGESSFRGQAGNFLSTGFSSFKPRTSSSAIASASRSYRKGKNVSFEESVPRNVDLEQEILDLCAAISRAEGKLSGCSLGVLGCGERFLHRVWPPSESSCCSRYIGETVSLDTLLKNQHLDKPARLKLGVQLALGVLSLHDTEWLSERWGRGDIYFPQETTVGQLNSGETVSVRKPDLERPLVRRIFGPAAIGDSTNTQKTTTRRVPLVQYNKTLLSLGIILVELWFGRRLEEIEETPQQPSSDNIDNIDNTEYDSADRLLGKIEDPTYSNATRRCIRGLDFMATTLDDEGFKNEVYIRVVSELEAYWKAYIGSGG
ncbi:hypothetical protein K440DRAFT_663669 [Wilcoxina mikolae CBS 423.85]|nr:hypothetical protein K440DRAFT_663669 [Wilcoxina mikolae CBS 423.85]